MLCRATTLSIPSTERRIKQHKKTHAKTFCSCLVSSQSVSQSNPPALQEIVTRKSLPMHKQKLRENPRPSRNNFEEVSVSRVHVYQQPNQTKANGNAHVRWRLLGCTYQCQMPRCQNAKHHCECQHANQCQMPAPIHLGSQNRKTCFDPPNSKPSFYHTVITSIYAILVFNTLFFDAELFSILYL